jgi:hypothetical protein
MYTVQGRVKSSLTFQEFRQCYQKKEERKKDVSDDSYWQKVNVSTSTPILIVSIIIK